MGLFSSNPRRKSTLKTRVLKAEKKAQKKMEAERLKARLAKAQSILNK